MKNNSAIPQLFCTVACRILKLTVVIVALSLFTLPSRAQTHTPPARPVAKQSAAPAHSKAPNLKTTPTLYLVGYAHLDTEWRWEYPQVISQYLPDTMLKNFALFKKYPHYIFNWTGSNR